MSNITNARVTVNRLKNDVRQFKAATSSGVLTPAQIEKLGSLLSDNVDVLDALLRKNTDVALNGSKIAQNDGIPKFGRSVGVGGSKVGQN
jgi:hypothetical protein